MKTRTIIGILLIVAGAWKLANMWGIIENLHQRYCCTWAQELLSTVIAATPTSGYSVRCPSARTANASAAL